MAFWNPRSWFAPKIDLGTRDGRADGWKNIMTMLGTPRDKRSGGRFDVERIPFELAAMLWEQDSMAARIIEKKARASMRRGYDINMGDKAKSGELLHYMKRQHVNRHFVKAKEYENAYGGSGIMPVINDGVKDLSLPLRSNRIQRIDGYNVYTARELYPVAWYKDPTKVNYGKPEVFRVQPLAHQGTTGSYIAFVHESRIIKFPGIRVNSAPTWGGEYGWGGSQIQRIHEQLRDIGLNFGNITALLQDFSQGVFRMNGLKDLMEQAQTESEGSAAIVTSADTVIAQRLLIMNTMRSILRALVMDKDDEFTRVQTPMAGLPEIVDRLVIWFAAVCDTPVTVLFGVSPEGLGATGESDIKLWDERVEDDQERTMPQLEQLIELNMSAYEGPLKGKVPDTWEAVFRPLRKPSEVDQAQARLYVAQADQLQIDSQMCSPEEAAHSRWGNGDYSPDMTIDWDAREKQLLAAPSVVAPEPPPPDPNAPDPNAPPPPAGATDPKENARSAPAKADPNAATDPKTDPAKKKAA